MGQHGLSTTLFPANERLCTRVTRGEKYLRTNTLANAKEQHIPINTRCHTGSTFDPVLPKAWKDIVLKNSNVRGFTRQFENFPRKCNTSRKYANTYLLIAPRFDFEQRTTDRERGKTSSSTVSH